MRMSIWWQFKVLDELFLHPESSDLQHFPWEMTQNIKPLVETNLHILGILLLELTARLVTHSRGRSRAARHRCALAWREAPLMVLARPAEKLQRSSTLILHGKFHYPTLCWCVWLDRTNLVWTLIYVEKRIGIEEQEKLPFMKKKKQYS